MMNLFLGNISFPQADLIIHQLLSAFRIGKASVGKGHQFHAQMKKHQGIQGFGGAGVIHGGDFALFGLLFPRHTGTTFKRYLAQKRIGYAVTLLQSTDLPVRQIAAMVGYGDPSTFYRNFTKLTGRQPSDYRSAADLETQLFLNMGWTF